MKKRMKTSNQITILTIIFLVTVIPTIIIYFEHTYQELEAYFNTDNKYKQIKTLGESILFVSIGIGYIICALLIIFKPNYRIPYYVILNGTVAIIILYYFRIYGIQVPFTEVIITDTSTDWRDVVTKICQQILVIPIAMLQILRMNQYRQKF